MTEFHKTNQRFDLRAFMVKHQYKVMSVSLVVGLMWLGIRHLLATSWFFSRLCLLIAIISFVPAGLVFLVHGRAFGPFIRWDSSDIVLTTRRRRKIERVEMLVMFALWAAIFVFVVVVIFVLSR